MVKITASQTNYVGYCVTLVFQLTQDSRDAELMVCIKEYWGCGGVYKKGEKVLDFRVTKFDNIMNIIIPFFQKHKIRGVKAQDFSD